MIGGRSHDARRPTSPGEASSACGFQDGGKHLGSSEAVALRGAAVEADLGRIALGGWESSAPSPLRLGDPGARGNANEEGSSPYQRALRSGAPGPRRARRKPERGAARHRHRLACWREETSEEAAVSFHGRGSTVRRVCSYVVACCRSRTAAPGSEKRISVPSNRISMFRGRSLASGGEPRPFVALHPLATRGARHGIEEGSQERKAAEDRVAMAKSRDRQKAASAVRKIGDDLPGRIEETVTVAMEGIPDCGIRGSFTGIAEKAVLAALGDSEEERRNKRRPFGGESREATGMSEARSCEPSRGRERPERRRPKVKRTKAQGPPKRVVGVVKHRILHGRTGARVPMTSLEAHEVRVLVVE